MWVAGLAAVFLVGLVFPLVISREGREVASFIGPVLTGVAAFDIAMAAVFKRQLRNSLKHIPMRSPDDLMKTISGRWIMMLGLSFTPVILAALLYWLAGMSLWHVLLSSLAVVGLVITRPDTQQFRDILPWLPPA